MYHVLTWVEAFRKKLGRVDNGFIGILLVASNQGPVVQKG